MRLSLSKHTCVCVFAINLIRKCTSCIFRQLFSFLANHHFCNYPINDKTSPFIYSVAEQRLLPRTNSEKILAKFSHTLRKELWTIRTLANSALANSDPKKFGSSQFGPRPLINSDPDHWSIRTLFNWSIRTSKRKILWSIRTFSLGQFGPFPLFNSDIFLCSIRTFSIGQFGPLPYVFSIKKTAFRLNTSRPNILNAILIHIQAVQFAMSF